MLSVQWLLKIKSSFCSPFPEALSIWIRAQYAPAARDHAVVNCHHSRLCSREFWWQTSCCLPGLEFYMPCLSKFQAIMVMLISSHFLSECKQYGLSFSVLRQIILQKSVTVKILHTAMIALGSIVSQISQDFPQYLHEKMCPNSFWDNLNGL